MSLTDRLGLKKGEGQVEIIGMRPELLEMASGEKPQELQLDPIPKFRPPQQIPLDEVESLLRARAKGSQNKQEELKKLLAGEVKLSTIKEPEKVEIEPAPAPKSIPPAKVEKKVEQPPIVKLAAWIKTRTAKPQAAAEVKKSVAAQPAPKTKEFIPDPPLGKGKKKPSVDELKKLKPKKPLSYEEAVEAYERGIASGKLSTKPLGNKKPVQAQAGPAAPRFTVSEINKFLMIKVMPSFIRSVLAKRAGVPFTVMCGIYKYEFIQMVKDVDEGHKIRKDLKDALNYESIIESSLTKRHRTVYALYSRANMSQRGRYSGTPLHPRLEERF